MALTYESDERFAKNINKNRNDYLNEYMQERFELILNKVFSLILYCVMIIVNHIQRRRYND